MVSRPTVRGEPVSSDSTARASRLPEAAVLATGLMAGGRLGQEGLATRVRRAWVT